MIDTSPRDGLGVEVRGTTLIATLNRPARANALDSALMLALDGLWASVADDTSLRCVIVTGAGERAFCAGADAAMLAAPRTHVGATAAVELAFVPGRRLGIPVIAAVNGVCAGGGLHFVTDADIAIASDCARFLDPHVDMGQVSGIEPIELSAVIPRHIVRRMVLLGRDETLDAHAAQQAGLVSEVVAPDRLLLRALELAEIIAQKSPEAVRASRRVMRDYEADLLRAHLDRGWQAVQDHWDHPDATEGPTAFSEKRPPRWTETRPEDAR